MAEASYTYPGGGYQLQTSGGPGGVAGLDDMMSFYREMAQRRMAQQEEDRARRMKAEDIAMQRQADAYAAAKTPLAGRDQGATHMQEMRDRDELLQMQARQRPAPTKMISGPQIIPGEVLDPMAMNAYQRKAYLPDASSMTGGATGQERAASQGLEDEQELAKARNILDLKSRAGGGLAGNRTADYYGLGRGGLN